MTREEIYEAYKQNADKTGCKGWYFLPKNCCCYKCGFDFYKSYGEELVNMFPDACPQCHYSFCE